MQIQDYVRIARRWLLPVVLASLAVAAAVYLFTKHAVRPVYTSSITMQVQLGSVTPSSNLDPTFSSQFAQTEAQIAQSFPNVHDAVALAQRSPGMARFAPEVKSVMKSVNCSTTALTALFSCSASTHDPGYSALVANSLAKVFISSENAAQQARYQTVLTRLLKEEANAKQAGDQARYRNLVQIETQVRLNAAQSATLVRIVSPARPPTSPSSPHPSLNAALGFILAFLVLFGGAIVADRLDDSIRREEDLKGVTGLPLLSTIPQIRPLRNSAPGPTSLVIATESRSSAAEAFRLLRTGIVFSRIDEPPRVLLVTSTVEGEGKSTVAANLAAAFAEEGKSVILVDLDLRRPCLSRIFDTPSSGLTNLLLDERADPATYLVPSAVPTLQVLPSGPVPPNPAQLVSSNRMTSVVEKLRLMADLVILDTPPLLAVTDPLVAGAFSDSTLLVVRLDKVHRRALLRAVEQLHSRGMNVVGIAVNSLSRPSGEQYYSYPQWVPKPTR